MTNATWRPQHPVELVAGTPPGGETGSRGHDATVDEEGRQGVVARREGGGRAWPRGHRPPAAVAPDDLTWRGGRRTGR